MRALSWLARRKKRPRMPTHPARKSRPPAAEAGSAKRAKPSAEVLELSAEAREVAAFDLIF